MIEQQTEEQYGREMREYLLPLPTSADGYTRALLVGTTGVGKTTLMRQFLGTHPQLEHFPTTSGGKTTTAEFEAILREGSFQAVITFIPKRVVQAYVEECVLAAAHMYLEGRGDESAANKLLEHEEQRFRLRYILGNFPARVKRTSKQRNETIQGEVITEEAERFAQNIQRYLDIIRRPVTAFRETAEKRLGSLENALDEDYDIYLEEMLEQELPQYTAFGQLIDEIITAIEQRFKAITQGEMIQDGENWPLYWTLETKDRQEFLKALNAFSGNQASSFGKLLTPLVQGMRIAGPFHPEWRPESAPHLVLIDGEGLGHTPDTAASVSTHITSRFEEVDAIVLVDTAKQPMQAASQSVLEASIVSGSIAKLFICFTHFEQVGGDAFADRSAREDHVRNSLDNVIASVSRRSGTRDKYSLRRSLENNVFFLSHLDQRITMKTQATSEKPEVLETREELRNLLATLEAIQIPPMPEEIKPVYDEHSLLSYIQKAVKAFRDKWQGLLGLARMPGMLPEHWTRIKALSRRPAFLGQDEYDTLRPIADLIRELSEQLKRFLESPLRWERSYQGTEEMRQAAIDSIARELYPQLHSLIRQRLMIDARPDWRRAYLYQGTGSTKVRARDIDYIYAMAAPTFSEMKHTSNIEPICIPPFPTSIGDESWGNGVDEFTIHVIEAVRRAVHASGGRIIQA